MGATSYGVFITFQALVTIGTMGDFGLGGSVGIEANRLLGARKTEELMRYLAQARTAFCLLALLASVVFGLSTPWLAGWLGLAHDGYGSTALLFLTGSVMIAGTVLANFTTSVSNAAQNLTWPILPNLFVTQLALASHLWLAYRQAPLWVQVVPYAVATAANVFLPWLYTKIARPELAQLALVFLDGKILRRLFSQSFWVYLWSLGYLVYVTTDRLVINHYFGPEVTSRYYLNYKPSELAVFLLVTLTFFTLNKIIQWHCSPDVSDRHKAKAAALRLQQVQAFLGLSVALLYLGFNQIFVRFWLGPGNEAGLILQALFAANLAISVSGDAGTKIAGQITARGTVYAGTMVGVTALLNLLLSCLAGRAGWLNGIAAATLVAQMFFGVTTGFFTAKQLNLSSFAWIFRATVLPILVLAIGFLLRLYLAPASLATGSFLLVTDLAILVGTGLALGINRQLLTEEWIILRSIVRK